MRNGKHTHKCELNMIIVWKKIVKYATNIDTSYKCTLLSSLLSLSCSPRGSLRRCSSIIMTDCLSPEIARWLTVVLADPADPSVTRAFSLTLSGPVGLASKCQVNVITALLTGLSQGSRANPRCRRFVVIRFYRAMHFSANARSWDRMSSVRPSVRPSVCNVGDLWSHRLEILETNCTDNYPNTFALCNQNAIHLSQGKMGKFGGD